MNNKLRFSILCLVAIGIFFIFFNLDKKFYWYDETFTSLRISGYTESEVIQKVATGQILTRQDLQKYQHPTPEKTVFDTVQGLATEEPQLTPLYFILARSWVQTFGNSIATIRSLSAFLSLLIFPSIYWLCLELFNSSLTGLLAVGLIAVSPFHLLYAQEARPYSLWTVTILVSSAALLRAIHLKKKRWWGIYTFSIIVGLYSHLLMVMVAISHAIYVITIERCRWTKTLNRFAVSLTLSTLIFLPWIANFIIQQKAISQRLGWSDNSLNLIFLVGNWVINITRGYFDIGVTSASDKTYLIPTAGLSLSILVLVFYAFYFLVRQTPLRVWLFLVLLVGVTAITIALPDVIFGGIRSTKSRYLIPCYLGIRLAISYLIANKIYLSYAILPNKFWKSITLLLITIGFISCTVSSQAETWWTKEWGTNQPFIARLINQSNRPLIVTNVSDSSYGNIVSLSYLLSPNVRFQLVEKQTFPQINEGFSDVFIYTAIKQSQAEVERKMNCKIEPVYREKNKQVWLWKKKNTPNFKIGKYSIPVANKQTTSQNSLALYKNKSNLNNLFRSPEKNITIP